MHAVSYRRAVCRPPEEPGLELDRCQKQRLSLPSLEHYHGDDLSIIGKKKEKQAVVLPDALILVKEPSGVNSLYASFPKPWPLAEQK